MNNITCFVGENNPIGIIFPDGEYVFAILEPALPSYNRNDGPISIETDGHEIYQGYGWSNPQWFSVDIFANGTVFVSGIKV